ncbi:MAG: hypothetical protein LKF93_09570 [Bifidobacterium tibiigranuli]|jgi:hypothetical protein|nr:hypothetical protein [Bifidobacterium tibiigranuli]
MITATEEAARVYPYCALPADTQSADFQQRHYEANADNLRRSMLRLAFERGAAWQAGQPPTIEPTGDEIGAAAKLLYATKAWSRLKEKQKPWESTTQKIRDRYLMNARSVLQTARKAGMEES